MKKKKNIKFIDPDRLYTSADVHEAGFFYWRRSRLKVMGIITADMKDRNILKTKIVKGKTSNRTRYYIKGSNIIRFIKAFEEGKAFTDPAMNVAKPYKEYAAR